jgi:signal transduction histidine kinase/ligand-binding sensor domain-containing protein
MPSFRTRLMLVLVLFAKTNAPSQVLPLQLYTQSHGLASSVITALAQDSQGFLWVGTTNGLSRFDGISFTSFSTPQGFPNDYITAIHESRHQPGTLWVGTMLGGLARFRNSQATRFNLDAQSPPRTITHLEEDSSGILWVATERGLYAITGDSTRPVVIADVSPETSGLTRTGETIWFSQDETLYTLEAGHRFPRIVRISALRNASILALHGWKDSLWISTGEGEILLVQDTVVLARWRSPGGRVTQIRTDAEGSLWCIARDGLLSIQRSSGSFRPPVLYGQRNGFPARPMVSLLVDREDCLWIGTWTGGLVRFVEHHLQTFPLHPSATNLLITHVHQDSRGHIWASSTDGLWEVWKARGGTWKTHRHALPGIPADSYVRLLDIDHRNRLWLHAYAWPGIEGFAVAHRADGPSQLSAVLRIDSTRFYPGTWYESFTVDRSERAWLAINMRGVAVIDLVSMRLLGLIPSSVEGPGPDIRVVEEDHAGNVWLGGFKTGLVMVSAPLTPRQRIRRFSLSDGLPDSSIRSIAVDPEGRVWIGTRYGGVAAFDGQRFVTVSMEDGLRSNAAWALAPDDRGRLWAATTAGLECLERATGRPVAVRDGLLAAPAVANGVLPGGLVWFATSNAINVYDYATDKPPLVPPTVFLTGIGVNGVPANMESGIDVPHDRSSWSFGFGGISFLSDRGVRFRYRLRGLDDGWSEPTLNRSVTYAELRAGTYIFEVQAVNHDNISSAIAASFAFTIHMPFWRTWWFITGAILVLGMVIAQLLRRRHRLAERERERDHELSRRLFASQEAERRRIAGELHDSLGQNLLIIKNRAVLALRPKSPLRTARSHLREISSMSSQIFEEIRTISHNLRPHLLDKLGITRGLIHSIEQMHEASATSFDVQIDPLDGLLNSEQEVHIYRIIQEAVNNIVRHAEARTASVRIWINSRDLLVEIKDDGKGSISMTDDVLPPGGQAFGLSGIEGRARLMGGGCAISSAPGAGTTITVTIPLQDAPRES